MSHCAGEPILRSRVRVLVVDDHAAFRDAARAVVEAAGGFELAGEAASGPEALDEAGRLRPDLVLLDVRLPGVHGLEVARRLTAARPAVVVVLMSLEDLGHVPGGLASCGAVAFVRKQDLRPALLSAVWARSGPRRERWRSAALAVEEADLVRPRHGPRAG